MQSNSKDPVEAETSTLHVGWSLFPSKPSLNQVPTSALGGGVIRPSTSPLQSGPFCVSAKVSVSWKELMTNTNIELFWGYFMLFSYVSCIC